jgi:hypothetical protein
MASYILLRSQVNIINKRHIRYSTALRDVTLFRRKLDKNSSLADFMNTFMNEFPRTKIQKTRPFHLIIILYKHIMKNLMHGNFPLVSV